MPRSGCAVFLQTIGWDANEAHRPSAGRTNVESDADIGIGRVKERFGVTEDHEFIRSNDWNFLNGWNGLNEFLPLKTDTTSGLSRSCWATETLVRR